MTYQILYDDYAGMTLASSSCVFIVSFRRGGLTVERVQKMREHEFAYARSRGRKFASLSLLEIEPKHALSAPPEAREAAARLAADTAPWMHSSAIVLEQQGFIASMTRSLITTINLVTKPGFPRRVFNEASRALSWLDVRLSAEPEMGFDRDGLARAVAKLKRDSIPPSYGLVT